MAQFSGRDAKDSICDEIPGESGCLWELIQISLLFRSKARPDYSVWDGLGNTNNMELFKSKELRANISHGLVFIWKFCLSFKLLDKIVFCRFPGNFTKRKWKQLREKICFEGKDNLFFPLLEVYGKIVFYGQN